MRSCTKRQAGIGSSSKGHAFSKFRKLKAVNEHNKYKRKQGVGKGIDQTGNVLSRVKRGKRVKPKSKYEIAQAGYKQEKAEKERLRKVITFLKKRKVERQVLENVKKQKELEEVRRKREKDLKQKQEVRLETNRKLNQRTKRGQPIMANHIEVLLEKIERG